MRILKPILIVIAIVGAVLTFPNSIVNPFTLIFLGFLGLLWFALRLGKRTETGEAPQQTQSPPL